LKGARKQLQALLGSQFDHEIVYTSGGTESDNAAILSALETQEGRNEIVTRGVEHPAISPSSRRSRSRAGSGCIRSASTLTAGSTPRPSSAR
jgi:cysteine sulfinate desulfinase/cysteine desulfurase-like protein